MEPKRLSIRAHVRRLFRGNYVTGITRDDLSLRNHTFARHLHEPLPTDRTIRLIKIEKGEQVSLQLKSFPLSELPTYIALSYTWGKAIYEDVAGNELGDLGTIHTILVNGKSFDISENLFDALLQFQSENVGWLWVDAICIDQVNYEERSSQVLLMGEIYSNASRVVVWLGKDIEDVDTMLWAQDVLYKAYNGISEALELDLGLLQKLDISIAEWFQNWESIERFFCRRRWYRRAWVFQETVLARQIELRNGRTILDWEKLSLIVRIGARSGIKTPSTQQSMQLSVYRAQNGLSEPLQDPQYRNSQAKSYGIQSDSQHWYSYLFSLACTLRSFQSTCEHDKIYAALGPVQKFVTRDIQELIIPDYEMSWESVFMTFTTLILRYLPVLIPLSYVEGQDRSPSLPSWCPDYRYRSLAPLIANGSETLFFQLFSASGPTRESEAVNNIEGEILSVSGKRIDVITGTSGSLHPMVDFLEPESIDPCLDICSKLPLVYSLSGQDRLEVLWRTMIIDQYYDVGKPQYHPAPTYLSKNFSDWVKNAWAAELCNIVGVKEKAKRRLELVERVKRWNHVFNSSSLRLPTPSEVLDFEKELDKSNLDLSEELIGMINESNRFMIGWGAGRWSFGRSLFRTVQHQMFGLGSEKMKEGDEVWLIKQTFVPFVLRPQPGGQYSLVGEAYVHGIMHGEWLERPGEQDGFRQLDII